MMTQAFYTGISGIRTSQYGIDVVSDNIANINTVGFRGSEYEFSSLFEKTVSSTANVASNSIGVGSMLQATSLKEAQGSLRLSDRSTDMAIMGDGWFGVQGGDEPLYTRNGAFTFDVENDLVTTEGYYVLGTMGGNIGADNVLTSVLNEVQLGDVNAQEKLRFPKSLTYPPEATTIANFSGNLGGLGAVRTMGAGVVDAQSNKNELKLTFTESTPQVLPGSQWDVVATVSDLGNLSGETIYDTKTGKVEFDSTGALISSTLTSIDNNGTSVEIDLGSGYDGVVSLTNIGAYASSSANGTIGGELEGYAINQNAEVIATFTNGMQSTVGKIAVYHFQNNKGLERISGTNFKESSNSGDAMFYTDASGQNIIGSDVSNFKLEGANIDISYGLTELIILQRSFDANSKTVTTSDQMMQKALNMDA